MRNTTASHRGTARLRPRSWRKATSSLRTCSSSAAISCDSRTALPVARLGSLGETDLPFVQFQRVTSVSHSIDKCYTNAAIAAVYRFLDFRRWGLESCSDRSDFTVAKAPPTTQSNICGSPLKRWRLTCAAARELTLTTAEIE